MPGTAAMSSTEASLMPWTDPKRRSSMRLRLGPMQELLLSIVAWVAKVVGVRGV